MKRRFLRFPDFKQKAVTLSYDDGVRQDFKLIEIMKKYGLKGTFNINGGMFSNEMRTDGKGRMTKEEALSLYLPSGMEVAVHGLKHRSLAEVDPAFATYDVISDRKVLEDMFGVIIKGMAYANGSYSDQVVDILKNCGINYSRTTVSTENFFVPDDWLRMPATCHHNNPKLMELAKIFLEAPETPYFWGNPPRLFYLWGHSYEFDNNNNWNVIEEFAKYVGNRDDVWYATNGEIYDYVKAYDSLVFSANGELVFNPTNTIVYLDYFRTPVKIMPGETIKLQTKII